MAPGQTVIVKLTNDTPSAIGPKLIASVLGRAAVEKIEPIFPGDPEPSLATLFNVTLDVTTSPEKAVAALKTNTQIEYAHTPQERKLY